MPVNAFYAQSGGVTAVINASASALILATREHPARIGRLYAGRDGILGALREDLIDTGREPAAAIAALSHTPGAAFGSCRLKLGSPAQDRDRYARLLEVFRAHDIGYFFYNGGNDSADTCLKIAQAARAQGYPLACIHVPKTVDNDLEGTDCCPGFGSVAKYVATSMREAALDVRSMAATSTSVFVLEVMGRHAGWITAACGLASDARLALPLVLLMPEVRHDEARVHARVRAEVDRHGYCCVAVSEGLRDADGHFLSETGLHDAFGHAQLGGAGEQVAGRLRERLGLKVHFAIADYLQRSARHLAAATDLAHAQAVGRAAVAAALRGERSVMIGIERTSERPYRWRTRSVALGRVAGRERALPRGFISRDGFGITARAREYLAPLVRGEAPPPYREGLPDYVQLRNRAVDRTLPAWVRD
jgi:6-phosphofructokinase 1